MSTDNNSTIKKREYWIDAVRSFACLCVITTHAPIPNGSEGVHLLVMRKVLWPLLADYNIHYAIQIPLIVILTASISYIIVHLISKLPGSKYIVGL